MKNFIVCAVCRVEIVDLDHWKLEKFFEIQVNLQITTKLLKIHV